MLKIYDNGQKFYTDNQTVFGENPLDTSFFVSNAGLLNGFDRENYAFKVYNDDSYLLVLRVSPFNLLLYGSRALCEEAADAMCQYELTAEGGILAEPELALAFLTAYESRRGGRHTLHLSMDIMYAESCVFADTAEVVAAGRADISRIAALRRSFLLEATGENPSQSESEQEEMIEKSLADYYCIRDGSEIIAIAKKTRSEEKMCSVSMVYTLPEYRGRGLSRKIVTKITQDILNEHKIPYLYVDKTNPISNHLYGSIGYQYGNPKCEYRYEPEE